MIHDDAATLLAGLLLMRAIRHAVDTAIKMAMRYGSLSVAQARVRRYAMILMAMPDFRRCRYAAILRYYYYYDDAVLIAICASPL